MKVLIRRYWRDNRGTFLTSEEWVEKPPRKQTLEKINQLPPLGTISQFRGKIRRLPRSQRRFLLAAWHVIYGEETPKNLHREKIMKALKIKDRMYRTMMNSLPKILP